MAPEVRLIGADGNVVGVMPLQEALKISEESGLDLVEISPNAVPPVCKIIDYGSNIDWGLFLEENVSSPP